MRKLDKLAVAAAKNDDKINDFILENEPFIMRTASRVAKRYVSKHDDEWSVALTAFYDAVIKYDYDRGSFYAFAALIIRQHLVDYFRSQKRYNAELGGVDLSQIGVEEHRATDIRSEALAMGLLLEGYGISFMDLTTCSPRAQKTREKCAIAAMFLLRNTHLVEKMRSTRMLPIAEIEKNTKLPRKTIERHRKYIVTVVEILDGDFPFLSEYVQYIYEGDVR